MLFISKTRAARSLSIRNLGRTHFRSIHATTSRMTNTEAAPAAKQAHFEGGNDGTPGISEIVARRAKAGRLVAGIAAASDSDMFKGSVSPPGEMLST